MAKGFRNRESDSYSYHGDALPRIIGALTHYPEDLPLYSSQLAREADVSIPTVSKTVQKLIGESLLRESGHTMGPHSVPVTTYETTEGFQEAVAANPEWQRAAVIKGLMNATGLKEGELLDQALALYQQNLAARQSDQSH